MSGCNGVMGSYLWLVLASVISVRSMGIEYAITARKWHRSYKFAGLPQNYGADCPCLRELEHSLLAFIGPVVIETPSQSASWMRGRVWIPHWLGLLNRNPAHLHTLSNLLEMSPKQTILDYVHIYKDRFEINPLKTILRQRATQHQQHLS